MRLLLLYRRRKLPGELGEEQDQESAVPIEAVAELEVDEPVAAATATESEE